MKSPLRFGGIMLPAKNIDLTRFATVACDQFTSDSEYWDKLARFVGDSPSALKVTYPEIFLSDEPEKRMKGIERRANEYMNSGVFGEHEYDAILTERSTPYTKSRLGIVVSVDLSAYALLGEPVIRASEGVVPERIPVRTRIRKASPIELPHIMLLCQDPEGILVEAAHKARGEKLYDFDLNMGGGHLKGWNAGDTRAIEKAALRLYEQSEKRYGKPFLFAVGDGNHSLAAALQAANDGAAANSALCEIVNLNSDGVTFHPIHRLAIVNDPKDFIRFVSSKTKGLPRKARLTSDGETYEYNLPSDAVEGIELVSSLIEQYGVESVDYVHGESQLCGRAIGKVVGMETFAPDKETFFDTVARRGKLPRKTFSIGEGEEKRYYLEARRIR